MTTDRGRQFESALWQELMKLLGSTRCRTTAYHPSANGLVERFHRQLKASLKAQPDPSKWTEALPLVLLGIRSALKTDLKCCTAELVYGTTLRLPGEFFEACPSSDLADPTDYVTRLKLTMSKLKAAPVRQQAPRTIHIHDDLSTASHVYVRHYGVKKPLQRPYDGPYKVLKRSDKFYTLDICGRHDTVSLESLKPAHLEPSPELIPESVLSSPPAPPPSNTSPVPPVPPSPQAPVTTRSGRCVRWPQRYL